MCALLATPSGCAPCATPSQLLRAHAGGNSIYTTALIDEQGRAVDWDRHEQRLARGVQDLNALDAGNYAHVLAWVAQNPGASVLDAVRAFVGPVKAACLEAFTQRHRQQDGQRAGHVSSGMLLVLIPNSPASHGAMPGVAQPCMEPQVLALPFAVPPFDAPVQVVVSGPPRSLAHVKHTRWVHERQALEQQRPEGCAEVLLCDEAGRIMEGLVTSFCVICDHPTAGVVLMTAGQGQPALDGIMVQAVCEACTDLGITVVREPPAAADRHTWREAFLANCLRGVQPVSHVACLPGNYWGHEPWHVALPGAPGSITRQIHERIRAKRSTSK